MSKDADIRIFAVAADDRYHMSGGIVEGGTMGPGLSYGGGSGFALATRGSFSYAQHAVFFAITEGAAKRWTALISAFHALDEANRLPFYFSFSNVPNTYFEEVSRPDAVLDLDGSRAQRYPADDLMYLGHLIRANGLVENRDAVLHPRPPLKWVRANCITMFNFVAKLSGIDLTPLGENIIAIEKPEEYVPSFARMFKKAALGEPSGNCRFGHLRLGGGYSAQAVGAAEMSSLVELCRAAVAHHGSYEAWRQSFAGAKPLRCEPLPVPAYLAVELARAGLLGFGSEAPPLPEPEFFS